MLSNLEKFGIYSAAAVNVVNTYLFFNKKEPKPDKTISVRNGPILSSSARLDRLERVDEAELEQIHQKALIKVEFHFRRQARRETTEFKAPHQNPRDNKNFVAFLLRAVDRSDSCDAVKRCVEDYLSEHGLPNNAPAGRHGG